MKAEHFKACVTDAKPWQLIYVATHLCAEDADEFKIMGVTDLEDFAARRYTRIGPKFTFLSPEGRPMGCIGIDEDLAHAGLGTLWLIKADGWKTNRYIHMAIQALRTIMHHGEYRRIEALVRSSRADARRGIEWMGFQHEGTKRRFYRNGESAELFAFTEDD